MMPFFHAPIRHWAMHRARGIASVALACAAVAVSGTISGPARAQSAAIAPQQVAPAAATAAPSATRIEPVVQPIKRVRPPSIASTVPAIARAPAKDARIAAPIRPGAPQIASRKATPLVAGSQVTAAAPPLAAGTALATTNSAPATPAVRVAGPVICPPGMALTRQAPPKSRAGVRAAAPAPAALVNVCVPSTLTATAARVPAKAVKTQAAARIEKKLAAKTAAKPKRQRVASSSRRS